jgi:hypothetical protein
MQGHIVNYEYLINFENGSQVDPNRCVNLQFLLCLLMECDRKYKIDMIDVKNMGKGNIV